MLSTSRGGRSRPPFFQIRYVRRRTA